MKTFLLKLITGAALKKGLAYCINLIANCIAALRGVLDTGSINDESRAVIARHLAVLIAVHAFLVKVGSLFGAPAADALAQSSELIEQQADALRRITEAL